VNWIFLGVIVGSLAYLAQILLGFLDKYRQSKDRVEQSLIDLKRVESQLEESERARTEAEGRAAKMEEELLLHEQEISELTQKINARIPDASGTESGS
jgi:septal ring factor EnvC (AmiA/AmiB activator)